MAKSNMAAEANSIVQNGTGTAAMSAGSAIAVAIGEFLFPQPMAMWGKRLLQIKLVPAFV